MGPPEPRGYLAAGLGSALGMLVVFILATMLVHLTGEPTFSETLGFDHDGQLELSAMFIFLVVVVALVVGSPLGVWSALILWNHPRKGATAVAVAVLAPIIGLVGMARVPSAPGDPVLEPYVLLVSAFVAGLIARLLATR